MSRPVSYLIPATLLSISFVFTGCKTIYSDVYAPKRNHFIPVKDKPKPEPLTPLLDTLPPPSSDLPPLGLPPAEPPSPAPAPAPGGDAPMIPGL